MDTSDKITGSETLGKKTKINTNKNNQIIKKLNYKDIWGTWKHILIKLVIKRKQAIFKNIIIHIILACITCGWKNAN